MLREDHRGVNERLRQWVESTEVQMHTQGLDDSLTTHFISEQPPTLGRWVQKLAG
jgi:hypothetical protein